MTRNQTSTLVVFFLVVIFSLPGGLAQQPVAKDQVKVKATVVGYGFLLNEQSKHVSLPYTEPIVVRIDKVFEGEEDAKYVLVRYVHGDDEPALPDDVFDGKSKWLLKLVRERSCDRTLPADTPLVRDGKEISRVPSFRRPPGTEKEKLPGTILPCYTLHATDFSPISASDTKSQSTDGLALRIALPQESVCWPSCFSHTVASAR